MSTAELVKQDEAQISPMALIQIAVSQGADIDKLEKLMGLQERWQANQARMAFNVAFSDFKSEAVTIVKNVTVKDGPLKDKKYADLFGVVNVVTPVMSKHGLSHSWKLTKDEPAWMEVTCTIRHILGHSESVSMGAAPDTGPGRNAIQSRGSAKSYLERYTLLAAAGMAAANEDDDGNGSGTRGGADSNVERMPEALVVERIEWIKSCAQSSEMLPIFQDAVKMAKEDKRAIRDFTNAMLGICLGWISGAVNAATRQGVFARAYDMAEIANDKDAQKKLVEANDKRKAELRKQGGAQ